MSNKDDKLDSKHTNKYNMRLSSIATTLDKVNEEEDEHLLETEEIAASPISMSLSEVSLPTMSLSTSTKATIINTVSSPETDNKPLLKRVKGRRNSFSSFLSKKYAKTKSQQDQERIIPIKSNNKTNNNSTTEFQKGHRPRSFSEVPALPTPVERAPPVAITNKTPIYEYYGFVMYLASFVVFGLYIIWAYVPDQVLHELGITYYPNRYWALAIPIWLMTLVWFIFFSFMIINLMNTPPFDSYDCITDEHANIMIMEKMSLADRPLDWMPELYDLPISIVNEYLYHQDNADENFDDIEDTDVDVDDEPEDKNTTIDNDYSTGCYIRKRSRKRNKNKHKKKL
ncbi:unnamed protein product [Cunninghamella echinulata]